MKRRAVIVTITVLVCLSVPLGIYAWYRREYPFGYRTCWLPCMMMALRIYAADHDGWFPKGGQTPLQSLQLLPQTLLGNQTLLAGISGDRKETRRRVQAGLPLDESVSSWVYFPGFRDDDKPDLAIIWERQPGIAFNGRRASGHAVGFIDGHHERIPEADWPAFVEIQAALRETILANRKATNQ